MLEEYKQWKSKLSDIELSNADKLQTRRLAARVALRHGVLRIKSVFESKGNEFKDVLIILTSSELLVFDKPLQGRVPDVSKSTAAFRITPDWSVCEYDSENAIYRLCTRSGAFLVSHASKTEMSAWVSSLRQAIAQCPLRKDDRLTLAAAQLVGSDSFHRIIVEERRPLGLALEATIDGWLAVRSAPPDSGVCVGSLVMSVSGESALSMSSAEAQGLLRDWQPPLTLVFRNPPQRTGFLNARSDPSAAPTRYWFRMRCGVLQGFDKPDGALSLIFDLSKSSLSIPDYDETQLLLCFYIFCGKDRTLLQCETTDEFDAWISHINHGIAFAVGGSYVRRLERIRATQFLKAVKARSEVSSPAWFGESAGVSDTRFEQVILSTLASTTER
jgi:hypothetical protein